jgi:hypothetical protein
MIEDEQILVIQEDDQAYETASKQVTENDLNSVVELH